MCIQQETSAFPSRVMVVVGVQCLVLCLVLHMERQADNNPGLVWALAEVARSENQKGFVLEGTLKTI